MITVYIKKIENISKNEKQSIINSLSCSARARLNKKRTEKIFLASLCALSLLNNEQLSDLDYTESGIPFFKNLNQDISISHSDTFSAIAISDCKEEKVGIDVEDISNITPSIRFLTETENQILLNNMDFQANSCPNLTREMSATQTGREKINIINTQNFIEIWTKKEALFKFLKNDSLQFIHLDSTTPEKYDVTFLTTKIENSILTICSPNKVTIEIIQK